MDPVLQFEEERREGILRMGADAAFIDLSNRWLAAATANRYVYHFNWLGRPIIRFPQDILAQQELIWSIRPDVIVETGIAHGGSIIFSASMLELIGKGEVHAVDIDIRQHNRVEIERHPMSRRITMHEGSSVDPEIFGRIRRACEGKTVMVILDSNHTHQHVLDELRLYGGLVSKGSYMIAMDTCVEVIPEPEVKSRPWGHGDNPMTAVNAFLTETDRFVIDSQIDHKLGITESPSGYLRCIK